MKERNDHRLALCGGLAVALVTGCAVPPSAPAMAPGPNDEVSVGYGVLPRDRVAGSISTVSPERTGPGSVTQMADLLDGRIPGLDLIRLPGGEFTVRIRGVGSLLGSNEPLLVIDDVPVATGGFSSAFTSIAPQDVARIDVLKDAASAGVYGMRGANGVIIVTTRRGR